jgi:hypothetical protein
MVEDLPSMAIEGLFGNVCCLIEENMFVAPDSRQGLF